MIKEQQYVTFGIGPEIFAVPVHLVQEILDPRPISRLPRAPDYLMGLMDFRGTALPVVDLRIKLGLTSIEPAARTRVIILDNVAADLAAAGVLVDCVFEVSNLGGIGLQAPPSIGTKWQSDCVTGVGKRGDQFVIVLDMGKLLTGDEFLTRQLSAAC